MTDSEPNREPKMDSSAPRRDAGDDCAWDQGTPAGESGPRPSRTDVNTGAGRAHLDPVRAAEVLDWCKREGGLDLYGWGDLISRLQECIVPLPANAPAKVSEAYLQGYKDAQKNMSALLDRGAS